MDHASKTDQGAQVCKSDIARFLATLFESLMSQRWSMTKQPRCSSHVGYRLFLILTIRLYVLLAMRLADTFHMLTVLQVYNYNSVPDRVRELKDGRKVG
jgi:hypothetical protein